MARIDTKRAIVRALLGRGDRAMDDGEMRDSILSEACLSALMAINMNDEPGETGRREDERTFGSLGQRARADIRAVLKTHYPQKEFNAIQIHYAYERLRTDAGVGVLRR